MCGYEQDEVDYNLVLLISRVLLDGHVNRSISGKPHLMVGQLTWEGQDFLDAIRSETVWEKTKDYLRDKDDHSVSFDVLKTVVTTIVTKQLGLN